MNDNNQHDGEIVGLYNPSNGGSCKQHDCCGMYVLPGDLIHLKREVMDVINEQECDPEPDAKLETVVKAVVIHDGAEAYTLGFLPCHVACQPQEAAHLHRKFSQILELYADDPEDCV
jgi:hypothetical protein